MKPLTNGRLWKVGGDSENDVKNYFQHDLQGWQKSIQPDKDKFQNDHTNLDVLDPAYCILFKKNFSFYMANFRP